MDAPPVQYVTTSDGYSIAYCVGGEGTPFVLMPFHHNHMQRLWRGPSWQSGLAQHYRVIHYDSRGQGLSTRGLPDTTTTDDFRRDLEAVIERVQLDRFVLAGYGGFSHVAVRYAVDHPERVQALVVFCTCATFSAWPLPAMLELAKENWELFLQMELPRDLSPEVSERFLDYSRQATNQGDYVVSMRAFSTSDISELLPRLRVPTLLIHSQKTHWLSPEESAKVAAIIANARLVFTGGDLDPDFVEGVPAIVDFLTGVLAREAAAAPPAVPPVGLSQRELEVLRLIAVGRSNPQIADELVISLNTVQRHVSNILAKTGLANRTEAASYAHLHQLV